MNRVPCLAVFLVLATASAAPSAEDGWTTLPVPGAWEAAPGGAFADYDGFAWYRCFVDVPDSWRDRDLALWVDQIDDAHEAFINGVRIGSAGEMPPVYRNDLGGAARYTVPADAIRPGRTNLIALRVYDNGGQGGFSHTAPVFIGGDQAMKLAGPWQFRTGDDPAWAQWPPDASAPQGTRFGTTIEAAIALGKDGRQTGPLSPAESLSRFQIPDDLEIEQVAAEPTVRQPVSINFDERGRMWVVQYVQYPHPAGLKMLSRDKFWRAHYDKVPPAPPYHFPGKDQITIHEDTDGDGTFDKRSTFLKGLNIVTSVARGRGGVWVLNPPYLLFYPDKDEDDVPDSDPVVHLAGFGLEDTHSVVNSLRWGPDGWLYAAQGSTVSADVVRPGLDTEVVHSMGQLIWRYHPETRRYEIFAEGGGNTFGVEIDRKGRIFSGHNGGDTRGFHYLQGGYSRKGFEKHGALSNPYAFGYFRAMGHAKVQRFTHTFILYEADALPEHYHGKLFGPNPVRRHVVYSEITPIGSTFRTRDLGHPITTSDQWFRPVDIKIGPDGAIYIADWYDGQVNHYRNHEGQVDPASGRIYRLKAKGAKPVPPVDLRRKTTRELIDLLGHRNRWFRQTALRLIGDRRDASVVAHLTRLMRDSTGQLALEALWALNLSGGFNESAARLALRHGDPHVRRWAVRLLGDERSVSSEIAATFVDLAATDPNVEVRSQLASTARRLPATDTLAIVRALLTRDRDTEDLHLPLLIWWAIESKAESDREAVLALFSDAALWRRPLVADHLLERVMRRYAMAGRQEDLLTCAKLFDLAPDRSGAQQLMVGFEKAFQGRQVPHLPDTLVKAMNRHGLGSSVVLGLRQGRSEAVDEALRVIADGDADAAQRRLYIRTFGEVAQPRCVPVLLGLFDQSPDESLLRAVLVALQTYDDSRIAAEILDRYGELPESLHSLTQETLTARPAWAVQLLHAIEAEEIAPTQVKPEVLEKLRLFSDTAIARRVDKLFGTPPSRSAEQIQRQIERFASVLRAEVGSPYVGRKLFAATCGSCHALFGKGGQVGPDLTSYRRDDLEFMLLHIVHPNAEIREGYENVRIETTGGLILTGVVAEQDNRTLVLRGASDQTLRLPIDQIDSRQVLPTSLMPQGLLDALTEQQTRDLFAYLRGTQPLNE